MEKKQPDNIRFFINAFALTLMLFAIIVTFEPYLEYEVHGEEIRQVERTIETVSPDQLPQLVMPRKSKPVMLVAYASWCPYCRKVMPFVVDMVSQHKLDNYAPVFVSLDTVPRRLSQYLVHNGYHSVVFPYVIRDYLSSSMQSALRGTGSSFTGTIPYIGFFDKNGKLKAEATGVITESKLTEIYEQSLK